MKKVFLLGVFLIFGTLGFAQGSSLSAQEIEQLKSIKSLVSEVDRKPLAQTMKDLEKTGHPQVALKMREAMARAYVDIVKEHGVGGQEKKDWLYSMVGLNMAYLQFSGPRGEPKGSDLNKLILRKLKEYLPQDIYEKPGFLCDLG